MLRPLQQITLRIFNKSLDHCQLPGDIELQTSDMQYARMENRTSLILFGSLRLHHGRNMMRCMWLKLHDTGLVIRSSLRETTITGYRIPNEATKKVGWFYRSAAWVSNTPFRLPISLAQMRVHPRAFHTSITCDVTNRAWRTVEIHHISIYSRRRDRLSPKRGPEGQLYPDRELAQRYRLTKHLGHSCTDRYKSRWCPVNRH